MPGIRNRVRHKYKSGKCSLKQLFNKLTSGPINQSESTAAPYSLSAPVSDTSRPEVLPSPNDHKSPYPTNPIPADTSELVPTTSNPSVPIREENLLSITFSPAENSDVLKPGYEGVKTFLRLIERTGDVFPPLKSVAGGLLGVCDIIESTSQNQQEFNKLKQKLEIVVTIIHRHLPRKQDVHSGIFARRLEGLSSAINHQIFVIKAKEERGYVHRLAERGSDASEVGAAYQTLSNLLQAFTMDSTLTIEENTQQVLSHTSLALLDKLSPVSSAAYDAFSPTKRHGCTEKTRVSILAQLVSWATDSTDTKIYWLNGMAGTGKTTISYSFSEILDKNQMLGASFFCSRLDAATGSVDRIFPTIAYQLALRFPSVYQSLLPIIERDPGIAAKSLPIQFRDIIVGPLRTASKEFSGKHTVITIEALDECFEQDEVNRLLEVISQHCSTLPVKFFITSRPERYIRRGFNSKKFEKHLKFILHDVEKDVVKADIELFARGRLVEIAEGRSDCEGSLNEWPPERELKILVELAGSLFIYAATACGYVAGGGNMHQRLSLVTNISQRQGSATATLDALYNYIVNAAYEDVDAEEQADIRLVLRTIVNVQKPLSVNSLGALFTIPASRVQSALSSLHSVIYVPSSGSLNDPISTLHASFPDFITTQGRAGTNCLERSESHRILALQCLALMKSSLQENTFQLTGQPPNSDIRPEMVRDMISEGLVYACTYWAFHVAEMSMESIETPDLRKELLYFFDYNVPKWIELLSVIGQLETAILLLRRLEGWIQASGDRDLWNVVVDTRQMITESFEIIAKHSLETYGSALTWLPKESRIRKNNPDKSPWKVIIGRRTRWNACEAVLVGHTDSVNSVALSPDGSRIASGSSDGTIRISKITTGECEASLRPAIRTDSVCSVAFSPDGQRIASGSSAGAVRIWHAVTGECEAKLWENLKPITSVAFSSDGSRVVYSSDAAFIWNITTGKCENMGGQLKAVYSVGFSADNGYAVWGSGDTVYVWNLSNGEFKAKMKGHSSTVMSVLFFPDGKRVVSGSSDGKIGIWTVATGELDGMLEGHESSVYSVSLSANGSHIVSGSMDNTVRVWNISTRACEAILEGHTGSIRSVAFSSDGTRVVSGSDDNSVRIWNSSAMGVSEVNPPGHKIHSIAISPDGSWIASGSRDKTIRIWSTVTGVCGKTLVGHLGEVNSIVFSPDGRQILSESYDQTARIWDVTTGVTEVELSGHTFLVNSVAFSPDGSRVVSGLGDTSVRIWDARTGEYKGALNLNGCSYLVSSVAFSPDGRFVVSASSDRTIRLWNATTQMSVAVLEGHSYTVTSVAFSPDGDYVISRSNYDKVVRIWNVETRICEAELVRRDWAIETAVLSDDSAMVKAKRAVFHDGIVVYSNSNDFAIIPAQSTLSLYYDDAYIRCGKTDQWCWVPPQFRNPFSVSYHGSKIVFGYSSGLVIALEYVPQSTLSESS